MKISYNWLNTFIDTKESLENVCEMLTMSGLEVEHVDAIESIKGGLKGLVVGKVLTTDKHSNADKLKVTTVDVGGDEALQIVCGAPNVTTGQTVVVAPVGCTIHPSTGEPFAIKKAKIRGESSMGMICAEDEIGLGKGHDGIMVLDSKIKAGSLVADLYDIEIDHQIEIAIIPNRGDAISHLGVARELQALTGVKYKMPPILGIDARGQQRVEVKINNLDACPRYAGISIENVKVEASPEWLQNRLRSIDINPINNVVDITNFVQHELGQPLHAFDLSKIDSQKIIVRNANAGEKVTTLDEVERELTKEDLVICDVNKPLALAGVLGGLDSGVTEGTNKVFIESAFFDPTTIRKTAKKFGLNTDASYRFERGTDPEMVLIALKRAINLICQITGGEVASDFEDVYPDIVEPSNIEVNLEKMNSFIGVDIPEDEVVSILQNLEIKIKAHNGQSLMLEVPKYRPDVQRAVDIYEEVIRIYGFDKIPLSRKVNYTPSIINDLAPHKIQKKISELLSGISFKEILTNSLVASKYYNNNELDKAVEMLNPLSNDMNILRMNLIDSGLEAVAYNINRKNNSVRFYEFGKTYKKADDGGYVEENQLQLTAAGSRFPEHWSTNNVKITSEQLVDAANTIFSKLNIPTKQWVMLYEVNTIDKAFKKKHQLKQDVLSLTINWDECLRLANSNITLKPIPVFPIVRRDLSLVLDQSVGYSKIEKIAKQILQPYLRDCLLFDVYEGKPLESNQKSFSVAFFLYNPKKTMEEAEIESLMNKLMATFESELKAIIRK